MTKTGYYINIFITNLGKYNEGELIGKWVELPIDDDALEDVLKEIGINEEYEEYFITDSETNIAGLDIGEYDSIEDLNDIAERIESLDDDEIEIIDAFLQEGYDFEYAIDNMDDVIVYPDCSDMTDVAYEYVDQTGLLDSIPDHLQSYFDYESFGRDMGYEGQYVFTDRGNCIQIL